MKFIPTQNFCPLKQFSINKSAQKLFDIAVDALGRTINFRMIGKREMEFSTVQLK